jgi:cytochrome b subunit of formate dehydrogenase
VHKKTIKEIAIMLLRAIISLALIAIVFAIISLYVSKPFGGPKKVINFLRAISMYIGANIHNFFCVTRLIKRRGIKSVYHRYPKTTDFAISSFLFIITIVIATIIALIAGFF